MKQYTESLRDQHKDFDVWSGLAVAVRADDLPGAAWALRERPELVQAVYAELADSEPPVLHLAGQIGDSLRGF